jgi:hypothetical protein
MLFSWYASDYCTDPQFADSDAESRANPSRTSWANPDYLEQQRLRLPLHKFRRLHLNLPGLPEGSAFSVEPVLDAIERGVMRRPPLSGIRYVAFVDMSGGSSDDATLAIARQDHDGRVMVDLVMNQGPPPPFDPRNAVERFAAVLREYRVGIVTGDKYAGETFRIDFHRHGIKYAVSTMTKSQLYEALEPMLNAHQVTLPDVPVLTEQLLGLAWRGGRIDHATGERDDWANSVAGAVALAAKGRSTGAPVLGGIRVSTYALGLAVADRPLVFGPTGKLL